MGLEAGHQIEIICFEFDNWSKNNNDRLIDALEGVKIIKIDAGRSDFFSWGWSVFLEKICRIICTFFILNLELLSQGISRRSNLLIRALSEANKPDIVIGHNPGALWPTIKAAQIFNCRAGFDVEDYHPGEGNDKKLQALTKQLMIKLIPRFNYVSFASKLILQQVTVDIGHSKLPWFILLNYFPHNEFLKPVNIQKGSIKMVWFSQNIKEGRGLELILPIVKKYINTVELYLIGNLDPEFFENNLKDISNVIIYAPKQQSKLHEILSEFDIGLALEPAKDLNNELAISNKLLAYLQAGLYVIATETRAQKDFLKDWPQHGVCVNYTVNNFESIIKNAIDKIDTIRKEKNARFKAFNNNNWETASIQLLNQWNN